MFTLRRSSIATFVLVFPCLMFVVIRVSERSRATTFPDLATGSDANEMLQMLVSSNACSMIRCDCDTNINANNASSTETDSTTPVTLYDENASNEIGGGLELDALSSPASTKPKVIYIITPTYTRPTQMADMTRLAQTLMLVKDIFWIVVEDAAELNSQVSDLLNRTGVPSVHLLGQRPVTHRDKRSGRGVSNRLRALKWLRDSYTNTSNQGVIYFADDDNAYDIRVFDEMRQTEKVSVFPVGCLAKLGVSSPIIDPKSGLVSGFHDPFLTRRKFAVDMAGFAVDLQLFLRNAKATMPYKVGYEEDYFIKSLGIKITDLEPKADNCTKVLVWHTKTQPATFPSLVNLAKEKKYADTNLPLLYRSVVQTTVEN